jgi:hypothetical protein
LLAERRASIRGSRNGTVLACIPALLIDYCQCDEHISGLLRASVGDRAAPLYMQVAVLRVKRSEFSFIQLIHFVRIQEKQYSDQRPLYDSLLL